MKNEYINFGNKLKMNNIVKTQIDIKKNLNNQNKNKNNNNIQKIGKNNINQAKNNFNNNKINKIGKIQKITKNIGKIKITNLNKNIDNNNILKGFNKQYTPNLKDDNEGFQYFNFNEKGKAFNNINIQEFKNNERIINIHKRSKSSNKPNYIKEQFKNSKLVINILNNYHSNNKDKNNYQLIINDKKEINNKKVDSPKKNKSNIKIINFSPKNKKIQNNIINKFPKIQNKALINNLKNKDNQINIKLTPYISYAFYAYQNKEYRDQMEDFHNFEIIKFQNFELTYFSIFDGHGGIQVPSFLKNNFHSYLLDELKLVSFSNDYELNNKNIISSINNTFEKIDKDIIDNKNFKNENGSTGTIIILYRNPYNPNQRTIICANIGDSKGYMIDKKNIKEITKDHKCDNENEVNRIKKKGGMVFQGRVFGTLMLTRSFGDKEFKTYGVLSTPDIYNSIVNDKDLFAIIASDGVWDVISKEYLFEMSKEKLSSEEFSKKIVITALDRGTRDNISCFVVKLNSVD